MATTTPPTNTGVEREPLLARIAQRSAAWAEKWFPDAFVFAAVGLIVVAIAALINGSNPLQIAGVFGSGFWDLTAFTLQMAMVVLTGFVVATSRPVARLIKWLANLPKTPPSAVAFVCLLGMVVSMLNWGLSLIFGALMCKAIARRTDIRVDYRALGAAGLMGLGGVWALGLSSSAAQLQATAGSIPPALMKITGVLDFGKTIFTWQSLLTAVILIVVSVIIAYASTPREAHAVTAADLGIDVSDEVEVVETTKPRPGEWLERQWILPAFLGLITVLWVVDSLRRQSLVQFASSLNGYLLTFLILGLVLHGTPRRFLTSVQQAVPSVGGILVQFPLYAATAAVLTKAAGANGVTLSQHLAHLFGATGNGGLFAVVLALYTALMGLIVPSGGGKWLIEAPYVMQAATDVGMNLGWTVQIYNIAEALPNMINPFFMLPLLGLLKLRARDVVGFTFLQFIIHLPIVLLLVWLLGMTFTYVAPVIP